MVWSIMRLSDGFVARRWLMLLAVSMLIAASCGATQPETTDAAVDTSAIVGAESGQSDTAANDSAADDAAAAPEATTTTARPTTTRAPAQLVEAASFDIADYEGQATVLWFWAPG